MNTDITSIKSTKKDMFEGVDFYQIDDLLTEEHKLIRSSVRDFVKKEISPFIEEWAQYRIIEILSCDVVNLIHVDKRPIINNNMVSENLFNILYWQQGAIELATGEKTLTLKTFESKYGKELKELIDSNKSKNIWKQYQLCADKDKDLTNLMQTFDLKANVFWPLAHYKSAVRYLQKDPLDIAATGGTNWQKYLPPRFQKVIFYPELWSDQEKDDWGKGWVVKEIFGEE